MPRVHHYRSVVRRRRYLGCGCIGRGGEQVADPAALGLQLSAAVSGWVIPARTAPLRVD